jgi:pantothenate kinase type III
MWDLISQTSSIEVAIGGEVAGSDTMAALQYGVIVMYALIVDSTNSLKF